MSDAHLSGDDSAQTEAYESGRAAGLAAISEMQRLAPLDSSQRAWLLGFLQGALDAAGQHASQTTRVSPPLVQPTAPSRIPESESCCPRFQSRIATIETHGTSAQSGWWSAGLEVEERGLHYSPGSSLLLWPTNDPDEVRRILRALDVSAQRLVPTAHGSEPAWQALLERFDLSTVGSETLRLLAEYSRSSSEASGLLALAESPNDKARSLLALLRRYPSSRPPLERLFASLHVLKPSFVPIASSSLERAKLLLIALRPNPVGNAWGQVGPAIQPKLRVGEWLSVGLDEGRISSVLSTDDLEPAIVIADGIHIAFARAFAAERRERRAKGRTWIIATGVQSNQFPFARALAAWSRAGSLNRFDVAVGTDAADTLRAFEEVEENLWRWVVDRSRCYLLTARQNLRTAATEWFTAMLARRYRIEAPDAAQRFAELSRSGYWVAMPSEPEAGFAPKATETH